MLDISAESAGTTSSNLNTTNPPFVANTGSWMNSTQQEISQALEIYVTPAVFVLGIVGNILALAVFSQKEFRNSLSSWLFRLLALVDSFALIMHDGMHVVPHLLGTSFLTYNTATCKVGLIADSWKRGTVVRSTSHNILLLLQHLIRRYILMIALSLLDSWIWQLLVSIKGSKHLIPRLRLNNIEGYTINKFTPWASY